MHYIRITDKKDKKHFVNLDAVSLVTPSTSVAGFHLHIIPIGAVEDFDHYLTVTEETQKRVIEYIESLVFRPY